MSFSQGKTIHGGGSTVPAEMKHPSQGILGKSKFCRASEEATWTQGTTGWQVRDFFTWLADPIFQGKVR